MSENVMDGIDYGETGQMLLKQKAVVKKPLGGKTARKKWLYILGIPGTVLAVAICVLGVLLAFSIHWMFQTWANLTMDELVYHLTAPLDGANKGMILDYLNKCAVPVLLILLLLVILLVSFRKSWKQYIGALCVGLVTALIAAGSSVSYAWSNLDAGSYVKNQGTVSTFIEDNYVNPENAAITFPEKKRNLIYIYLESMETTYAGMENGGAFEENCIPELTELAQEYIDFSGEDEKLAGGYAMPGTTWTVAGMFAQTAGLPLNIPIEKNSMDTQDSFFPGIVTLGDILKQAGYNQTLLIGSVAEFGGRSHYFTEHGDFEMADYDYAVESGWIPEDYKVWWGYEDEKLFQNAKEKLTELSAKDEPFNLTMLTVDTHFEDGYVCEICTDNYDNQYANVMACSSQQLAKFIEWIQSQPFYENTTIVLSGDHPTMDSNFCKDIDSDYTRKVYTCFINTPEPEGVGGARDFTTFDMFPTTLAGMGAAIDGNRLGLGVNLFSWEPTMTERYGIEKVNKELSKKSEFLDGLLDLDVNKPELIIRENANKIDIQTGEYNEISGTIPLTVSNLVNVEEGIVSILAGVWTDENQEDLQWLQFEKIEDSTYYAEISAANLENSIGECHIQIYLQDSTGGQYMLGEITDVLQ